MVGAVVAYGLQCTAAAHRLLSTAAAHRGSYPLRLHRAPMYSGCTWALMHGSSHRLLFTEGKPVCNIL